MHLRLAVRQPAGHTGAGGYLVNIAFVWLLLPIIIVSVLKHSNLKGFNAAFGGSNTACEPRQYLAAVRNRALAHRADQKV